HPKPLLVHRVAGAVEPLQGANNAGSPALGLFDGSAYETAECSLEAGDLVMLFTDGLYDVEGPHQDSYNPDWLVAEVRRRVKLPAGALFDQLLSQLKCASPEGQLADDVCLVGVEVMG